MVGQAVRLLLMTCACQLWSERRAPRRGDTTKKLVSFSPSERRGPRRGDTQNDKDAGTTALEASRLRAKGMTRMTA